MAAFSVTSLHRLPRHCTPKAREVVLNIINSANAPLKIQDIYKLAVQPTTAAKSNPNSAKSSPSPNNETIRSMRYLKTIVLRDLAGQNRVEKVKMQGAFNAWVWRLKTVIPATPAKSTKPSFPALPGLRELEPAAVGVGEDWSHLNKRRQKAREKKVARDLQRMQEVQRLERKMARKALAATAKSMPLKAIAPTADSGSKPQPSA